MELQGAALSAEEMTAFVAKLETFAAGLSPNERTFLRQLIDDAADAANEDESGYAELSGKLQTEDGDVSGYAMDALGTAALSESVMRYGAGIRHDESISDLAFVNRHLQE